MSNVLPVEDLSKTYLEHSMVINNFVIKIGSQIKDSLCRVVSLVMVCSMNGVRTMIK